MIQKFPSKYYYAQELLCQELSAIKLFQKNISEFFIFNLYNKARNVYLK